MLGIYFQRLRNKIVIKLLTEKREVLQLTRDYKPKKLLIISQFKHTCTKSASNYYSDKRPQDKRIAAKVNEIHRLPYEWAVKDAAQLS